MILKNLLLHNFRICKKLHLENLSDKINYICGNNAQGKTTILEAIYFLSTGRSFRTNTLSDLIHIEKDYFYIEAEIENEHSLDTIKIFYNKNKKKLQINGEEFSTFTPLLGNFLSVIHTPYDLNLISGSPSDRRRFLNLHISQSDKNYLNHLARFSKALKNRNILLKNKNYQTIFVWENEMAKSAKYLILKREEFFKKLNEIISKNISKLSTKEKSVELKYFSSVNSDSNYVENYLKLLKKYRFKDYTEHGPHRDDFEIFIENNLAKNFASEGQKKTLLTNIKLAELDILSENKKATFCFDDFDSFLDDFRKVNFQNFFKDFSQTFITSTKIENKFGKTFVIENGFIK